MADPIGLFGNPEFRRPFIVMQMDTVRGLVEEMVGLHAEHMSQFAV